MKKFKITATIPTVQYGNIQPEYEVEAESFEEAEAIALPYIEKLWAKYCQKGSELKVERKPGVALVEMTSSLTPGVAMFDPISHTYYNDAGEVLLSGSVYSHQFKHPFEKDKILATMEEKHGIDSADIDAMWKLKSEISMSLGTAIHGAIEMYGKYLNIGEKLGANKKPVVNTALHDQPILKNIVESFFKGKEKEDALYEEFIIDLEGKRCGQVDRVKFIDRKKKIVRIQDYKTNADVNKKGFNGKLREPYNDLPDTPLGGYWLQLSFYADILAKHGYTVEALDIFTYTDRWETYTHEPIKLLT